MSFKVFGSKNFSPFSMAFLADSSRRRRAAARLFLVFASSEDAKDSMSARGLLSSRRAP